MGLPYRTVDHREIMQWANRSRARPAMKDLPDQLPPERSLTLLFIDSPPTDSCRVVGWDEWFEYFDDHHLIFLHDEVKEAKSVQKFSLHPQ